MVYILLSIMEEKMSLNEIELKLCLLKKRTKKAIERNEATISRLERSNHDRDAFVAALEGRPPPILADDSLFNASLGSTSTEHSDPEPQVDSDDDSLSSSEYRNDAADSSDSIDDAERHGVENNSSSSSSFESSVSTTASSTASRVEAFLQMAASEERLFLARLGRLRAGTLRLQWSDDAVATMNQSEDSQSSDSKV